MLNMTKSITLNGNSVINGVIAESYQAIINSERPEDMNISSWQTDKAVYKANRVQCRKDSVEFEEAAYSLQDEIIQKLAEEEVVEE